MAPTGKKYKLFAAAGGKSPCAFFASEGGCRNGKNCKFLHVLPDANNQLDNEVTPRLESSGSSVSSESDEEINDAPAVPTSVVSTNGSNADQAIKTKKRKSSDAAAAPRDIFAKPKGSKVKKEAGAAKKQKISTSKAQQTNAKGDGSKLESNVPQPKTKRAKKSKAESPTPDFRSLDLPIASFSVPGQPIPTTQSARTPTTTTAPPAPSSPDLPLPLSTPTGRKWKSAVLRTREHPRFSGSFDFNKFIETDQELGRGSASDWVKCRPWGTWCASNPQAIAIDCEMVETQDPVTGMTDGKALCRLSVINAEDPSEVLLDTLVKPLWPVVDYRSHINGIKAEHLENVQFTLRHAQAFLMALCSQETVIIGHALDNDLVALKMEHYCVVDSSLLFRVKDATPLASPSLRDLAKSVMKKAMPDTHDSVNDARTALACLEVYREKDGEVDPVERTERSTTRNPLASSQLFVHRIPKKCEISHLSNMFLSHTFVNPKEVADIEYSGDTGKTLVTFASVRHARLAFDILDGDEEPDKSGRMQKKVYLKDGGYVRVRKMVHDKNSGPKSDKDDQ